MFEKIFFFTPLFSTCFWIRDPGSEIRDPGSETRDKHPGSATLLTSPWLLCRVEAVWVTMGPCDSPLPGCSVGWRRCG